MLFGKPGSGEIVGACVFLALLTPHLSGAEPVERIPAEKALEDTKFLFEAIERVHPEPLARIRPDDYLALKKSIREAIQAESGKDQSIAVERLAYHLYRAAAALSDGHTSLGYKCELSGTSTRGVRFPPFALRHQGLRLVIDQSTNADVVGHEIVEIEGALLPLFLAPVIERLSAESLPFALSRFEGRQDVWWYLSDLIGERKVLRFTTVDPSGKKRTWSEKTLSWMEYAPLVKKLRSGRIARMNRGFDLKFLQDGKIAYLNIPTFAWPRPDSLEPLERKLKEVIASGATGLILDVRENGGGDSAAGEMVMAHLAKHRIRTFSAMKIKLCREVLERKKFAKYAQLEGMVMTSQIPERRPFKQKKVFTGKVVILTSGNTFSAASSFAAMVRDYERGFIVGTETGGHASTFGDSIKLRLPHSKLRLSVSYKQFFAHVPRPGDDRHGLLPDVVASAKNLRPFRGDPDPVLSLAVDYLKKNPG
jgi:hypothetical protein